MSEIVITVGAKQGLHAALLAIIDPGDEVLVFDPSWVSYAPSVTLAGGMPVPVALERDGFRLSVKALEARLTRRSRALVLNTPHNPTGRVFDETELAQVADLARRHSLWVIADESFDQYVFDGRQHRSLAALPGMRDQTVVLQSFSKAYAMPGCRIGYLAAPEAVCRLVARYNEQVYSCVSPFLQRIALSALNDEPDWGQMLRTQYERKRDVVVERLLRLPKMRCAVPEGTFYVFPDASGYDRSSARLTEHLLEQARVAVTPGSAFGATGEGHLRFNLVGSLDHIHEGLNRIHRVLR